MVLEFKDKKFKKKKVGMFAKKEEKSTYTKIVWMVKFSILHVCVCVYDFWSWMKWKNSNSFFLLLVLFYIFTYSFLLLLNVVLRNLYRYVVCLGGSRLEKASMVEICLDYNSIPFATKCASEGTFIWSGVLWTCSDFLK